MELVVDSWRWQLDSDGPWLCLRTRQAQQACGELVAGKPYAVTIKQKRNKRSMTANAYCWVLLEKLAKVLGTEKNELYKGYVKQYGLFKDFTLTEEEAKTFRVVWERMGTGWPTEQVDFSHDGEKVVIRAYYGSSQYNTRQMSRLIDSIVEDCKEVGIETLPPEKLAAMKEAWK